MIVMHIINRKIDILAYDDGDGHYMSMGDKDRNVASCGDNGNGDDDNNG